MRGMGWYLHTWHAYDYVVSNPDGVHFKTEVVPFMETIQKVELVEVARW